LPTVSMIIPVHNEMTVLPAKLANVAGLHYPAGRLDVCFVSDGSSDGTTELLERHAGPALRVVTLPGRSGKAAALNAGLAGATGEIVLFTDASILLADDAVEALVAEFADPRVGCVSGEDRIAGGSGEGLYGRYELAIRRLESAVSSIVGASGSIYAMRRSLCHPFPATLAPDFWSVLRCVEQGFRAVSTPRAIGSMTAVSSVRDEFSRKVRTLVRGMTTLGAHAGLLNPFRHGIFAVELWSHKVLRWLVPLLLAIALMANVALLGRGWFFIATAAAQGLGYAVALAAFASPGLASRSRLAAACLIFMTANAAAAVAALRYLRGFRQELWTPSRRDA
jgi:cellulose synthase/poly-beta-1,6-N-acetylglucosamine synthase-like glycosyltransferase